jgi:hypothetical protein
MLAHRGVVNIIRPNGSQYENKTNAINSRISLLVYVALTNSHLPVKAATMWHDYDFWRMHT